MLTLMPMLLPMPILLPTPNLLLDPSEVSSQNPEFPRQRHTMKRPKSARIQLLQPFPHQGSGARDQVV